MKRRLNGRRIAWLLSAVLLPAVLLSAAAGAAMAAYGSGTQDASADAVSAEASADGTDASAEADVALTEETEVQSDDTSTDPVTTEYILAHLDERFASGESCELVNFLVVKQTIADGDAMDGETSIDGLLSREDYAEAILTVLPAATAVYDVSDESNYYVSYADTLFTDEGYTVTDAAFAVYDNDGQTVEGCVYDAATGLVYLPKELYMDEEGDYVIGRIQVQLLQVTQSTDLTSFESDVSASLETQTDLVETGSDSVDMFDFETTVETVCGADPQNLIVSVNGIPTDDYEYDAEAGLVTVYYSSASISSVSVKMEEETLVSQIKSLFAPISVNAATTVAYGSNQLTVISENAITFSDDPSVGQKYYDTMSVKYEADADDDETTTGTSYGGSTDAVAAAISKYLANSSYTKISSYKLTTNANKTFLVKLNSLFGEDETIDFSDINKKMALFCSHISQSALGTASPQTINKWTTMDVMIRVLKIDESAGTIVLGFLTETNYTQTGYGIAAFKYEVDEPTGYASLDLTKLGTDSDGNVITSTDVSRAGAVYTVYSDSSCTETVKTTSGTTAKLTTNTAFGDANAIKIPLSDTDGDGTFEKSENTVYVKETTVADGYYLDPTVYTVNLVSGGVKSYDSSSNSYVYNTVWVGTSYGTTSSTSGHYVVYDELVETELSITKLDSSDDTAAEFPGAVYTVYEAYVTDSIGDVTTDSEGQPSLTSKVGSLAYDEETGQFNTLSLTPGYYYIKETTAPDGYELDPLVYRLKISVATNASGSYDSVTASVSYCSSVSGDTISWKEYTDGKLTIDGLQISITFYDEASAAKLTLAKSADTQAAVTAVTEGYQYSLAGAVYYVYTDEACTQRALDVDGEEIVLTTTEDGTTNTVKIEAGSEGTMVYIREISASPGYLLTNTEGNYAASVLLTDGETVTVSVTEDVDGISPAILQKTDEESRNLTDASAIFRLNYYYQSDADTYTKDLTLYYQTDEDGVIDFSDPAYLVSGTPYTNEDGAIVFYAGKIVIEETRSPADYQLNDTQVVLYLDVDADGALSVTAAEGAAYDAEEGFSFSNEWRPDLTIQKTDTHTGEGAGSGFSFRLSGTTEDGEEITRYASTTDESAALFEAVEPGTYTLTETVVPHGYILSDLEYTVVVDADSKTVTIDGQVVSDGTYTIQNTPYVSFSILKKSTGGNTIRYAAFRLSGVSDAGEVYESEGMTTQDGTLTFYDLAPGTYFLIETDVTLTDPAAALTDTIWTVTVSEDGSITLEADDADWETVTIEDGGSVEILNLQTAELTVKKETLSGETVAGVVFHLYGAGTGYDVYASTDGTGEAVFSDLLPGEYILTEYDVTDADPAVRLDQTPYYVTVSEDGTVTVTSPQREEDGSLLYDEDGSVLYDSGVSVGSGDECVVTDVPTTELTVRKYSDAEYEVVSGVVFRLCGTDDSGEWYDETVTTDADGKAVFSGLTAGVYTLLEQDVSDADPAVLSDETLRIVTVTWSDGAYTITVTEDGETQTLNQSGTYTIVDIAVDEDVVMVIKQWVTEDISQVYSSANYSLLTAKELPILHLVTDEGE